MRIKEVALKNFRNIKQMSIFPDENTNIIFGNNAQGKTNLLESIWLFTGGRSFRGSKDGDLIYFSEDKADLKMSFNAQQRDQWAHIEIAKNNKRLILNGVDRGRTSAMIGKFCAVIFSPVHLALIKDGPNLRRKFIDAAICQIKPSYACTIAKYNHVLDQRNALLKDIRCHSELIDTLEIWDDRLSKYAALITVERLIYVNNIKKYTESIYLGISSGKEPFKLQYISTFLKDLTYNKKDIENTFKNKLKYKLKSDMITTMTSIGPHRDDLEIFINDKSARTFASQGQQRSAALTLKLAEANVLRDSISEKPIILLDDVMSELDSERQNYILNSIDGWQVFITCCDPLAVTRLKSGKKFEISNGTLKNS